MLFSKWKIRQKMKKKGFSSTCFGYDLNRGGECGHSYANMRGSLRTLPHLCTSEKVVTADEWAFMGNKQSSMLATEKIK